MNHLRKVLALLMTFAMLLSCVVVIHAEEHDCPSKDFIDAPAEGNWAHEGVDYMIANGIMNGTSESPKLFSPKIPTNRAMIVQILYRLSGQPEVTGDMQFSDVAAGRWYYNAILWAVQNGVTKGVSDTQFNPDGYVTREQIAAFLYRFEAPEEAPDPAVLAGFPDSETVSNYAKEPMSWAVGKGIINGKGRDGESYLDPKANANRDEVATMVYRYLTMERPPKEPNWISTWATAEENFTASSDRVPNNLNGTTVRQIIRVTTSGKLMKLKFSNEFGNTDVVVHSLHVAKQVQADKSTIDPATDTVVTVGESEEFIIPKGKTIETDPFAFEVEALENIAVSMYFGSAPNSAATITGHRGARATTYQVSGNKVSDETITADKKILSWYFLCEASLDMPEGSRAVVCFGDSITDGYGTDADYLGKKPDSYTRWGDYFAKRLQADEKTKNVAVLNEGIGANSMFGGSGPAGRDRYARDLLDHNGVAYVIILFGVNDLNRLNNTGMYDRLKPEFQKMIDLAHENGIKVYLAPILPFGTSNYYSTSSEQVRTMLNDWFRSADSGADGIIDFESAVADPNNPKNILEKYTHTDGLHPYDGYDVMADAIDLELFY